MLLEATRAGVSASFLNQPLEQNDLRWLVRSLPIGGYPQIIMRLGYGPSAPATPRRPPEHVLAQSHFTDRR